MRLRHAAAVAVAAFASAAIASGCGGGGPTSPPRGSPVASSDAVPSSTQAASVVPSPSIDPTGSGGPAVDTTLLSLLPPTIDGLDVQHPDEYDAIVATDPQVVASADRFVTALVADPGAGEFATGPILHLRPGVMTDRFYRDWRDSFDTGACSQASGVTGHAEAEIAGRTVFIGTCAGGSHTYHVWLPARQVLVSINALGDRLLGEKLMAALHE